MTERRPLVAVSTGFADYGDYYGYGYGRPLLVAGAVPVMLFFMESEEDRMAALQGVDGLVLAGGRDIESWRYGRRQPHPAQGVTSPHLDEIELSYARLAVEGGIPLLGVCRGCQVINVAFGGTLFGDLSEFPDGGADHPGARWEEWRGLVAATLEGRPNPPHPTHPIDIAPGSMLAGLMGERAEVDSYHHQGIDRPGRGIRAVAWGPHRVAEAIEMPDTPTFVLGVQWEIHEEWQRNEWARAVWGAFVASARRRMDEREGAAFPT